MSPVEIAPPRAVFAAAFLLLLAASRPAGACAPARVDTTGYEPLTVEEAVKLLKAKDSVTVALESMARCPGAGNSYTVLAGGEPLGVVDAPVGGNSGAALIVVVREMLKTPKPRLKALLRANKALHADMQMFDKAFRVRFSFQNALPLSERYPGLKVQRLMAVAEECTVKNWSTNSGPLGHVDVSVSEYIPGRSDYGQESIYKKGELGKAFTKAGNGQVYRAYLERVELNAENCQTDPSGKIDWKATRAKLTKPTAPPQP